MTSSRFFTFLILITLSSCLLKDESPIETSSSDVGMIQSGDIVVVNSASDTILVLDEDGYYKDVLVDSQTDASILYAGLAYDSLRKKILYILDSTVNSFDAVMAISPFSGKITTEYSNINVSGTGMAGVARLTGGELVVIDTTTSLEKIASDGTRNTTAPFPLAVVANGVDVAPLSTGGFVVCVSATANTVRTYNLAGTLQATATSATPTPSLGALAGRGCAQDPSGRIIVAYTNAVRAYNSTMTTTQWTFSDTNVLTNASKLAVKPNGNILVLDQTYNHIVEISSSGTLVRTLGGTVLSTPSQIMVVP